MPTEVLGFLGLVVTSMVSNSLVCHFLASKQSVRLCKVIFLVLVTGSFGSLVSLLFRCFNLVWYFGMYFLCITKLSKSIKACCSQYCPRSQGGLGAAGAGTAAAPANRSLKTTEKLVSGGLA